MLDPSQYLRMRNLFGMMMPDNPGAADMMAGPRPDMTAISSQSPTAQIPSSGPWAGVNFAKPTADTPPVPTTVPAGGNGMDILPTPTASMAPKLKTPTDFSDYSVDERMRELYHPETSATDRFNQ